MLKLYKDQKYEIIIQIDWKYETQKNTKVIESRPILQTNVNLIKLGSFVKLKH